MYVLYTIYDNFLGNTSMHYYLQNFYSARAEFYIKFGYSKTAINYLFSAQSRWDFQVN